MPLLELLDIGYAAGTRPILAGRDLTAGRVYGLVGPNGSDVGIDVLSHPQRHEPISYLL